MNVKKGGSKVLVTTKIISFDDASEEIEQSFHQTVKKWLDTIWNIMEPRLAEEDVKLGLKQLLNLFVTPIRRCNAQTQRK